MAYCQSPIASSSAYSFYRKLCTTGESFRSSGLKDGVCFNDLDKRIFHSTYRATHHVMASITQILPLEGSSRVHSPRNTEKSMQSEESIEEPERSICIADLAQRKVHNCVQTSFGCFDTQTEQEKFVGFHTPTILSTHPEASSLLSSEPLQNGHANPPSSFPLSSGVGDPEILDLHISYLEIQEPWGLSEFHVEPPEAPLTRDLQPEVKSWDFEGLGNQNVKDSFCTMENVCIDDEERESLVLEENGKMLACIGSFSTERVDVKDSFCPVEIAHIDDDDDSGNLPLEEEDIISACIAVCATRISDVNDGLCILVDVGINESESPVLEANDIMSACIGGCSSESYDSSMRESKVVCSDYNAPSNQSETSFDCWKDAKTNHSSKLSPCRWHRIWKVLNLVVISSPGICDTFTKKKLSFRSLPTSLQKQLLKNRSIDWEVAEQLMAYFNIYLRVCRLRHLSARGRRAVENADARRDGHYKKVNVQIIFQDHQKCRSKGTRNRVSGNCHLLEHNRLGIEQAGQYASIQPSKVVIDSALKLSCLLEARDEHSPRSIEPSSDGVSKTLKGSLKQGESDLNLFLETSSGSTSKLRNLVEVRDGGMRRESSLQEMDEFIEDRRESSGFSSRTSVKEVDDWTSIPADQVDECLLEVKDGGVTSSKESLLQEMDEFKELSGFPSLMSVNEVDDWTSVPADQVDECLDTCLYSLQHHPTCSCDDFTPELKLLNPVLIGNPVKPVNSVNDGLNDEGSPIFNVHANETNDLISLMPYGGVHERQSRKKLEHFAEGFLLGRHIRRQQRRAQQAPPYPPRDSAGYVLKNLGIIEKLLGEVKPNPYVICSIENNNDLAMNTSATDNDCSVGADVVIDIVGLIAYMESQCSGSTTYLSNYTDTPLLGGQVVNLSIGAVIVTIIAIVVYTRTLLKGGLAWVGARAQKEEDN